MRPNANHLFYANVIYQLTLISAQGLLIAFIYLNYSIELLDEFFYILSYLLPVYTFFLLGVRQLRLSERLTKSNAHLVRFISLFCFTVLAFFLSEEKSQVFYMILFWKINDYCIDAVSLELQIDKNVIGLCIISIIRLLMFVAFLAFFNSGIIYFMISTAPWLVLYGLYTYFYTTQDGIIKIRLVSAIYLGFVASISSIVVAYPRIVIGSSENIEDGILSLVSFISYFYLIGQVIISAMLPVLLPRFDHTDGSILRKLKGKVKIISVLSCLLIIFLFLMIYSLALLNVFVFSKHEMLLILSLLICMPLIFLVNFIEAFSSIRNIEGLIVISTLVTAVASLLLSNCIADLWNGFGYALVIFLCFLLRLVISASSVYSSLNMQAKY
ncbi:hypothetical protein CWE21_10725 [Pseudidiomarina aquimaris]|uniref:Uncharacterized protein n=1 Tax=Pseudidiomarina aquimaris TaxID=641841 RepID=A0A432XD92_9GAMM|nr:hypothetical protein CWE21_10725 [Pseudidiomarina aquimaris]